MRVDLGRSFARGRTIERGHASRLRRRGYSRTLARPPADRGAEGEQSMGCRRARARGAHAGGLGRRQIASRGAARANNTTFRCCLGRHWSGRSAPTAAEAGDGGKGGARPAEPADGCHAETVSLELRNQGGSSSRARTPTRRVCPRSTSTSQLQRRAAARRVPERGRVLAQRDPDARPVRTGPPPGGNPLFRLIRDRYRRARRWHRAPLAAAVSVAPEVLRSHDRIVEDLGGTHERRVDAHDRARVVELATIIGSGEERHELALRASRDRGSTT